MTRKKNKLLKDFLFWLLLGILLFGTIAYVLMYITPNVNASPVPHIASTDNDYVFSDNIYYDDEPEISIFNQRNQTQISENYLGTYSFEDDIGGFPADWDDFNGLGSSSDVIANKEGHDSVIKFNDSSVVTTCKIENGFDVVEFGTVEFWIYSEDVTYQTSFELLDGGTAGILYYIVGGGHKYYSGGHNSIVGAIDDTWYRVRIDFECGVGGYLGLNADHFFITINETKYGSYEFTNVITNVDLIRFSTVAGQQVIFYVDAVGIAGINYTIGQNMFPYYAPTNVLEADKWEFAFDDYKRIPEGAIPTELESGWQCGVWYNPIDNYISIINDGLIDNQVVFNQSSAEEESDLYNWLSYGSTTSWYELNIKLTFKNFSATEEFLWFVIKDNINADIIKLQMSKEYFRLYNNDTSSYQDSYNVSQVLGEYLLTLYWSDIGDVLYFFVNDTFVDYTYLDTATGINVLWFYTDNDVSSVQAFYIDYISLYENGLSLTTELGGEIAPLSTEPFISNYINLFEITMVGNVSIDFSGYELFPLDYYNGTYFLNLQDEDMYALGGILIIQANGTYNISSIYIHGVMMTEGINEYYPYYSTSNVNITESYFYVDSNNRLQYTLTTNDTNLEYISISFDIINIASMNRSIVFSHLKSDVLAFSEFRLYYSDSTYTSFISSTSTSWVNSILPQSKVIETLNFIATDDDNDLNTTLTGYFSSITLVYNPNIQTTISTLSLLEIIPLLFLLVFIPFVIYMKFKNAVVVIPTFILMTIIGITSGLIPNWVGVVLIIGSISTYVIKKEVMD